MPRFIRAPQARTVPLSPARPASIARPAEAMPLSGAQTTRFNPIGLCRGLFRGYNALQGIQQQGLTGSTGLSGLGAGLGLTGAFPGLNPQVAGGLQAGGQLGTLLGQLANPSTFQNLRGGFTSGAGLNTASGLAGGALSLGGTVAGLAGADPGLSLGLSTAGTLAPFIGGVATGSLGTGLTAAGMGAGAATGTATATSGALAGASAAALAVAPVLALYAIGTTLGSMRERDIEKRYGRGAKEGITNFTTSPTVQGVGQNLARFQSGDMSVLPQIQDALLQAFRTQDALNQPAGSTGIGILPFTQSIFDVLKRNPSAYNSVITGLADSFIPSRNRYLQDPTEFLAQFGFLPRPQQARSPAPGVTTVNNIVTAHPAAGPRPDLGSWSPTPTPDAGAWSGPGATGLGPQLSSFPIGQRPGPFGTYY